MTSHLPQFKAVIFDLLTALIDSWTAWDEAAFSGKLEDPEKDAGLVWRKHYLELTYGCGAYQPYPTLVRQAAARAGLPAEAADKLEAGWDSKLKPWPELAGVLRQLKARGYKLGVVTNCSDDLGHRAVKLCEDAVGNGFVFDAVVTAEETGYYKPRREPYEATLRKLGVDASQAVFVAGSSADVPGAGRVGMKVLWHNRIGLVAKEGAVPDKEGKSLDAVLQDLL